MAAAATAMIDGQWPIHQSIAATIKYCLWLLTNKGEARQPCSAAGGQAGRPVRCLNVNARDRAGRGWGGPAEKTAAE